MKIASNKIADIIRYFRNELSASYEKEELDTIMAWCFEEFAGIKKHELNIHSEKTVSESQLLKFNFAVKDLKQHKPIQYILGKADFYGMKFIVNSNVLIPRPETEELVDLIIKEFQISNFKLQNQSVNILDIGTGSGCIAISLKKNILSANVVAMDISEEALKVAGQNAVINNVEINFLHGNILHSSSIIGPPSSVIGPYSFDIIVSNPPYVCISEKEEMQKNVLDYEPHLALFVEDNNPLLFYNAIADFALTHLNKNGRLYFEINGMYGEETKQLMVEKGFKNIELKKDLNNKNRILRGEI